MADASSVVHLAIRDLQERIVSLNDGHSLATPGVRYASLCGDTQRKDLPPKADEKKPSSRVSANFDAKDTTNNFLDPIGAGSATGNEEKRAQLDAKTSRSQKRSSEAVSGRESSTRTAKQAAFSNRTSRLAAVASSDRSPKADRDKKALERRSSTSTDGSEASVSCRVSSPKTKPLRGKDSKGTDGMYPTKIKASRGVKVDKASSSSVGGSSGAGIPGAPGIPASGGIPPEYRNADREEFKKFRLKVIGCVRTVLKEFPEMLQSKEDFKAVCKDMSLRVLCKEKGNLRYTTATKKKIVKYTQANYQKVLANHRSASGSGS